MSDPLHVWTVRRLLVCVPATLAPARRDELRAVLGGQPSIDAVLELLTADGLAATPPFACAEAVAGGTRVVIRGDLEAVAHGLDGSALTLGAGRSSTWNDDVVTDISAISLALGPDGGRFEWLVGGVAPPAPSAPATPAAPATDHTLDEQAFQQLVADEPVTTPTPTADGGLDFSSLLEHTRSRAPISPPSEPTVVLPELPPPPPAPPPPPDAGTGLGEHDGRTITLADLRRLQADGGDAAAVPEPEPIDATPARPSEVRAVRCPAGHANPLTTATCRTCGQAITDQTVVVAPRPAIARLVFDSGLVVDVDRPQLIGRRPTAPADAEELPNLITVPSPDGDVSRAHTAIRIVGWDVLVEDVGSTNGTEVRAPGGDLVRLREHEPVLAVVGTEVSLARTIRFTIEAPERS